MAITYPRILSNVGWVPVFVLSLLAMCLLSSSLNEPWWTIRVWNSNNNNICNEYVSIILASGVCSEDGYGKSSTSDCTKFSDSSAWNDADDYLNGKGSDNNENADLEGATDVYINAKNIVAAGIFFVVANIVVASVSILFSTKDKGSLLYKGNFQYLTGGLSSLSALMALVSFASTGNNDMTDGTYWEILLCPDGVLVDGTVANSYYTVPDSGYGCAASTFAFAIVCTSLILSPGGCCFIPCACCAWSEDKECENEALLPNASIASAPSTAVPAVAQSDVNINYTSDA